MIWLTSDNHFGHKNIIGFSGRPFSTVSDMDEEFMRRWNTLVRDSDEVYHIGDLSYRRDGGTAEILRRLNGKKFLIPGNHDTPGRLGERARQNIEVLPPLVNMQMQGIDVTLCHYPIESWKGKNRGSIHLHGHSHNKSRRVPGRVDVGVDCWDYYPVSFDAAVERARSYAQEKEGTARE